MAKKDNYFSNVKEVIYLPQYEKPLQKVLDKLGETSKIIGLNNPKLGTENLRWGYCKNRFDWVASFYVGELWLAYTVTGDEKFKNLAQMRTTYLEHVLTEPQRFSHDLGFVYSLSAVADYKLTRNPNAKEIALKAAFALSMRYRKKAKFIQAWSTLDPEITHNRMIADTMQNIPLLFWAAQETGQSSYYEVALNHAKASMKYLVRDDFSSYHTFYFDIKEDPSHGNTHQGYADESCWARGQAWLIHGFAQTYQYTQDESFLKMAQHLADYAMEHAVNGAFEWDFLLDPKETHKPIDSSAMSISAAGMLIIADSLEDPTQKQKYLDYASTILDTLIKKCDLTDNKDALGLLDHGAAHVHMGVSDTMLPYGDYYYLEALMRANGHINFFW